MQAAARAARPLNFNLLPLVLLPSGRAAGAADGPSPRSASGMTRRLQQHQQRTAAERKQPPPRAICPRFNFTSGSPPLRVG